MSFSKQSNSFFKSDCFDLNRIFLIFESFSTVFQQGRHCSQLFAYSAMFQIDFKHIGKKKFKIKYNSSSHEVYQSAFGQICFCIAEVKVVIFRQRLKKQKPTTPGIPRRSPIQVLTGPDVA